MCTVCIDAYVTPLLSYIKLKDMTKSIQNIYTMISCSKEPTSKKFDIIQFFISKGWVATINVYIYTKDWSADQLKWLTRNGIFPTGDVIHDYIRMYRSQNQLQMLQIIIDNLPNNHIMGSIPYKIRMNELINSASSKLTRIKSNNKLDRIANFTELVRYMPSMKYFTMEDYMQYIHTNTITKYNSEQCTILDIQYVKNLSSSILCIHNSLDTHIGIRDLENIIWEYMGF